MKFIGFALIEMQRATGTEDVETARSYDCVIYDKFGRVEKVNLKLGQIERDWGRMRMTENSRWAILEGSDVRMLTFDEFAAQLARWDAKVAA